MKIAILEGYMLRLKVVFIFLVTDIKTNQRLKTQLQYERFNYRCHSYITYDRDDKTIKETVDEIKW